MNICQNCDNLIITKFQECDGEIKDMKLCSKLENMNDIKKFVFEELIKCPANSYALRLRQFDNSGNIVCSKCGEKTNKIYAQVPHLICWNCGSKFPPIKYFPDAISQLEL